MQLRRGRKYGALPAKSTHSSSINKTAKTRTSSSALNSQADSTDCRLLSIPPELRNAIYEYTLCEEDSIAITRQTFVQPPLLRTCRTIRAEAGPIYYVQNSFHLQAVNFDPSVALAWYGHSSRHYKPGTVSIDHIWAVSNWSNLSRWLHLFFTGELLINYGPDDEDLGFNTAGEAFDIVRQLEDADTKWETVEKVLECFKKATDNFMHWVED